MQAALNGSRDATRDRRAWISDAEIFGLRYGMCELSVRELCPVTIRDDDASLGLTVMTDE